MSDVDVPGIGSVDKRWVWAGVALTAGIVGYAWWSRGSSGSSDPTELDPTVSDGMGTPTDGGWGAVPGPTNPSGGDFSNPSDEIDTNAEWTQYAVETLQTYGFEPQFTAATLGKWLARQPLTVAEKALVLTARGLFGEPPVGGPYPILDALPDPPGGGGPGPTPRPAAPRLTATAGRVSVNLTWTPVTGATGYTVHRGPSAQLAPPRAVGLATSYLWGGLKPSTTYTWSVYARLADGEQVKSNVVTQRTNK